MRRRSDQSRRTLRHVADIDVLFPGKRHGATERNHEIRVLGRGKQSLEAQRTHERTFAPAEQIGEAASKTIAARRCVRPDMGENCGDDGNTWKSTLEFVTAEPKLPIEIENARLFEGVDRPRRAP